MRKLLVTGTLAVGVVGALVLAAPQPAEAIPPINPLGGLDDVLGAGVNAITGGVAKAAVEAFGAIVQTLFAWPAKLINRELLAWLVAVPDYTVDPATARAGRQASNLAQLGATTTAMAFAALGAVGTLSAIRYWAAGLTGSGGLDALEGLARTVAAALLIVLWPWLFSHCAELANEAGRAVLGSGSVLDDTARLFAVAFGAAVTLNIFAILIAMAAAGLLLALLVCKIAVSVATALVFVGMPLAVMLWPLPELAWIARTAMRAFATVLIVPLAWAVSFATFAAIGIDALSLKGAGSVVDALVMPLVAIALLWITVILPKTLARLAMFGAFNGGGLVNRTAGQLAARRADSAVAQTIPASVGGRRELVAKAGAAASKAAVGAPAAGAAAAVAKGGGWKPPPGFGPAPSGGASGWRNPSWKEIKDHVPLEMLAAADRQSSTTRSDVAGAMQALRPDTRAGVIALMESRGGQIRGRMAHQAARGDLDEVERDAFRTLAAATPAVRAQGIEDFVVRPPADQPARRQEDGRSLPAPGASGGATGTGTATPPPSQVRDQAPERGPQ